MTFLSWHYSEGIKIYLKQYTHFLKYIVHFFSLSLLVKTLFSPWKKMLIENESGFNLSRYFQNLSFNLISRGIGAVVRTLLLITGIIFLTLVFMAGLIDLLLLLILPFLSIGFYIKRKNSPQIIIKNLVKQIKDDPNNLNKILFSSKPGSFVVRHIGTDISDLINSINVSGDQTVSLNPNNFEELTSWYLASNPLSDEIFRKKGISKDDIVFCSRWWDQNEKRRSSTDDQSDKFGRPGIGLELIFGYTPILNKYCTDLSAQTSFSHHLIGREEIVSRIERTLSAKKSVFLTGLPGVGKKTVIFEFAKKASLGDLGKEMSYRRVLELDYQSILATSGDLNVKKTRLSQVLDEASYAGNIILVIKDLHRITNFDVEGYDFTDIFNEHLEKGKLSIITIISSFEYERFVSKDPRLAKYFETLEVTQPTKEFAMEILMTSASEAEIKYNLLITAPALKQILDGSDRYITETPFPEKTLDLLDAVIIYRKTRGGPVVLDDVNQILSEKTGISFARLTDKEKEKLSNLEQIIHEKMINQERAISLIAKSLRSRTVGVKNDNRPIGSFLFLGPTGVGKTQTAKALANVYFGNENNLIRFDMAEFIGNEGISRLIGSVYKNYPGELTTAIKNHPASLILFDEIEKSPPEIFNLFLTLLDEGYITDAFGKKINCKNIFVIATSNAAGEYIRERVTNSDDKEDLQNGVIEYVQKNRIFSPEFLNRFDGVVVYEPLKPEDLIKVADLLLKDLQKGLLQKNVYLQYGQDVSEKIAKEGYEPSFGARPMRRIIDLEISDLLGKSILNGEIQNGDKILLKAEEGKNIYSWEKI